MNCEVEFLPVGEASRAGDAIVVRYGSESTYQLILIDGGHIETGSAIVEHLRSEYPGRGLQHVVLTHPDIDHASGLRTVLEEMPVANLWVILPWNHAAAAAHLFEDKAISSERLATKIRSEYPVLEELVEIAEQRGIPILWPFQGTNIGPFTVLSPSIDDYVSLLPQFDRTPNADVAAIRRAGRWIGKETVLSRIIAGVLSKTTQWIPDWWDLEQLRDGGKTSATNETSVVLYGLFDTGRCVLLTGDVGITGLNAAANYAEWSGLPLQQFSFVQIPHHGSRSNVGPTILNRIIGFKKPRHDEPTFTAFASAPKDDENHPRKMVLNAFMRRGAYVHTTRGQKIVYYGGFVPRFGYSDLQPLPFAELVEAYDT
jgi:beta-lactamase superfamily II metal-dependent hydrolase